MQICPPGRHGWSLSGRRTEQNGNRHPPAEAHLQIKRKTVGQQMQSTKSPCWERRILAFPAGLAGPQVAHHHCGVPFLFLKPFSERS
ncbi:hypothetical protein SRHO_G00317860 [Serrasalmus rhombeus]